MTDIRKGLRVVLFCEHQYAINILQPIETEIRNNLNGCGYEVLWFVDRRHIPEFPLKNDTRWTHSMQEVYDFSPEVIFVPGNIVPYYLPGVKAEIFHGYAAEKKDHWIIRRYIDIYLTQGPFFTRGFEALARKYLLIKSGAALERAQAVRIVAFDKTGTLTVGEPQVTTCYRLVERYSEAELLEMAGSLEQNSSHPLAQALVAAAQHHHNRLPLAKSVTQLAGFGLMGTVAQHHVVIGNQKLIRQHAAIADMAQQHIQQIATMGQTPVLMVVDGQLAAVFAIADSLKGSSPLAVAQLQQAGVEVVMITGDTEQTAQALAAQCGITCYYSDILPDQKAAIIQQLQQQGVVAMVGDGINDAPALAQADVGIAIKSGTDVAIETADIVVLHQDLRAISRAIAISRKTHRTIKENLFWAFAYNVIGLPIAMGLPYALGGMLLDPMIAGLAMAFSSVSVLANTLRLKRYRF